jgi:hypothetical protein
MGCCGGDAPDAPDYGPLAAAQQETGDQAYQLGIEQLAWSREQWGEQYELIQDIVDVQLPIFQQQAQMAAQGMDAYLAGMDQSMQIAAENHAIAMQDRDRYERVFQPMEDELIAEAQGFDSQARRSMEAGRAQADVARAQEAQRQSAMRQLESVGVDPTQTRYAALDAGIRTQQAAAQAAAGNAARQQTENVGRALRADVLNIGRGMPSQAAASYGLALQGAGQGTNAGLAGQQAMLSSAGMLMNAGSAWQGAGNAISSPALAAFGQANTSYGAAANTQNMGYQNQLQAFDLTQKYSLGNQAAGVIGAVGGGMLGGMLAEGGPVEGPGGPKDDAVPIRASDGEYVVDADTVRWKGLEFFDKLKKKAQEGMAETQMQLDQEQQQARARQGVTLDEEGNIIQEPMFAAEGGSTYQYRQGNTFGYKMPQGATDPNRVLGERRRALTQQRTASTGYSGGVPTMARGVAARNQGSSRTFSRSGDYDVMQAIRDRQAATQARRAADAQAATARPALAPVQAPVQNQAMRVSNQGRDLYAAGVIDKATARKYGLSERDLNQVIRNPNVAMQNRNPFMGSYRE